MWNRKDAEFGWFGLAGFGSLLAVCHVYLTIGRIVTPATPLDNLLLRKGDTSTKVEFSLGNKELQKD